MIDTIIRVKIVMQTFNVYKLTVMRGNVVIREFHRDNMRKTDQELQNFQWFIFIFIVICCVLSMIIVQI